MGAAATLKFVTRSIPIHWDDLESAFERNSPDTECFLSVVSGHVVAITAGNPEAPLLKEKVAAEIHEHTRVEPASSREQYRWMERFVISVEDEGLRTRLLMAIDGKGAFRRFKDVLVAYPTERERWFTYRSDLLHWHMAEWLREKDVEASTVAPWGDPQPPRELADPAPRPLPSATEPPGEALRRQARDLIDVLPAIELPSALAFLEFLRGRGGDTLRRTRDDVPQPDRSNHPGADDRGDDEITAERAQRDDVIEVEPLRRRATTDLGEHHDDDAPRAGADVLGPAAPPLAARAGKR